MHDKFNFSKHGFGNKNEFIKRKEKLLNKITKAVDKEGDILFSSEEISYIIVQIRLAELKEKKEHEEIEEKIKRIKKENEELMKHFTMK